eukprot:comp16815_c0_seq2/m.27390 comp16815_c0_seq2/g.27390  ORF comp16815_c0_seq2/g.27390 comp16815_c0_seq2/m.27390 type:complete len:132 (+) comp16815_c0_seq2:534-929(+)
MDKHPTAGFTQRMWQKPMELPVKGGRPVSMVVKRPYILASNGTIVTIQRTGYVDQVTFVMFLELVIETLIAAFRRPVALLLDNCSVHKTAEVMSTIRNIEDLHVLYLPENTTDILQPCDLALNSSLKAALH